MSALVSATLTLALGLGPAVQDPQPERTGHGHTHAADSERAGRHPTTFDASRFLTSRKSEVRLPLPEEEDAFFFTIFGDRTGGHAEDIAVLEQAVHETNLLDPDLVMTVGDLIQGYNRTEPWLAQMREFKQVMGRLDMPWFPVAGNHDVYWRGPNKPPEEHEGRYEIHFGPLWYAFEHKDCWFVVLYSDEPNPKTGERNFNKPSCQRMSPEQLGWLRETLQKTRDARHVFVFIHHPRWLAQYGKDWEKVHAELAAAGNVRAVFAGHIHRMRYDGMRDGIEYFALATVGGHQWGAIPDAGYLHEFHVVTVRDSGIEVAALPVGEVMDARAVTGEISRQARLFATSFRPVVHGDVLFDETFGASARLRVTLPNPIEHDVEMTVTVESLDPRWVIQPDHRHLVVRANGSQDVDLAVHHPAEGVDSALDGVRIAIHPEFLAPGLRFALPVKHVEPTVHLPATARPAKPASEHALSLDGDGDWLELKGTRMPAGPFTVECWLRTLELDGKRTLISPREGAGVTLRLVDGVAECWFVDGRARLTLRASQALRPGVWHHVAASFDGSRGSLHVDGVRVADGEWDGVRAPRVMPFAVGTSFDRHGATALSFDGLLDELRVVPSACYTAKTFEPARRGDDNGRLVLHMDASVGRWAYDSSPHATHLRRHGDASVVSLNTTPPKGR